MPTVYGVITARIVDKLEAGTVPWHKVGLASPDGANSNAAIALGSFH